MELADIRKKRLKTETQSPDLLSGFTHVANANSYGNICVSFLYVFEVCDVDSN